MIIVLMGVTGSGKTTIGRLLAAALGWEFYDADDFHPRANVEKMHRGIPLDDDDRRPWLETLQALVTRLLERNENAVFACSALKETYRKYLVVDARVKLIYLKGDHDLIAERLRHRHGHFMNPQLLDSQFETLEEPREAVAIDVSAAPDEIVKTIEKRLGLTKLSAEANKSV